LGENHVGLKKNKKEEGKEISENTVKTQKNHMTKKLMTWKEVQSRRTQGNKNHKKMVEQANIVPELGRIKKKVLLRKLTTKWLREKKRQLNEGMASRETSRLNHWEKETEGI